MASQSEHPEHPSTPGVQSIQLCAQGSSGISDDEQRGIALSPAGNSPVGEVDVDMADSQYDVGDPAPSPPAAAEYPQQAGASPPSCHTPLEHRDCTHSMDDQQQACGSLAADPAPLQSPLHASREPQHAEAATPLRLATMAEADHVIDLTDADNTPRGPRSVIDLTGDSDDEGEESGRQGGREPHPTGALYPLYEHGRYAGMPKPRYRFIECAETRVVDNAGGVHDVVVVARLVQKNCDPGQPIAVHYEYSASMPAGNTINLDTAPTPAIPIDRTSDILGRNALTSQLRWTGHPSATDRRFVTPANAQCSIGTEARRLAIIAMWQQVYPGQWYDPV